MKRWLTGLLWMLMAMSGIYAQWPEAVTTSDDAMTQLRGQPLMLRGFWAEDKLKFDQNGKPVADYSVEPFTECGFRFSGETLIYCIVDTNGKPMHLSIARPVGLGLDEEAVDAVSHYRFRPAMKDGKPVPVDMYIKVNFQIF